MTNKKEDFVFFLFTLFLVLLSSFIVQGKFNWYNLSDQKFLWEVGDTYTIQSGLDESKYTFVDIDTFCNQPVYNITNTEFIEYQSSSTLNETWYKYYDLDTFNFKGYTYIRYSNSNEPEYPSYKMSMISNLTYRSKPFSNFNESEGELVEGYNNTIYYFYPGSVGGTLTKSKNESITRKYSFFIENINVSTTLGIFECWKLQLEERYFSSNYTRISNVGFTTQDYYNCTYTPINNTHYSSTHNNKFLDIGERQFRNNYYSKELGICVRSVLICDTYLSKIYNVSEVHDESGIIDCSLDLSKLELLYTSDNLNSNQRETPGFTYLSLIPFICIIIFIKRNKNY